MRNMNKVCLELRKKVKGIATGCILLIILAGCKEKYTEHLQEFREYIKTGEHHQLDPSKVAAHVDPLCSVGGVDYLVQALENEDAIDSEVATVALAVIYESLSAIQIDKSAKAEIRTLIEESMFFEKARDYAKQSTSAWVRNNLSLFLRRVGHEKDLNQ